MTEFQKTKILHFFDVLDHDGNGFLEQDDFELVSETLCDIRKLEKDSTERLNLSLKSHSLFVKVLSDLNKGTAIIRKDEWLRFFENEVLTKSPDYIGDVSSYLFTLFDRDGDGFIDEQEYLDMFKAYGLYTAQAKKAFDLLDRNNDQRISRGELVTAFEDFFLSNDENAPGNWIFGNWNVN